MSMRSILTATIAAAVLASMPQVAGAHRPMSRPRRRHRTTAWRDYAAKVISTHSDREDPRDDKYLHSHARINRAVRKEIARRAA